jgi:hypothetical protein
MSLNPRLYSGRSSMRFAHMGGGVKGPPG